MSIVMDGCASNDTYHTANVNFGDFSRLVSAVSSAADGRAGDAACAWRATAQAFVAGCRSHPARNLAIGSSALFRPCPRHRLPWRFAPAGGCYVPTAGQRNGRTGAGQERPRRARYELRHAAEISQSILTPMPRPRRGKRNAPAVPAGALDCARSAGIRRVGA